MEDIAKASTVEEGSSWKKALIITKGKSAEGGGVISAMKISLVKWEPGQSEWLRKEYRKLLVNATEEAKYSQLKVWCGKLFYRLKAMEKA